MKPWTVRHGSRHRSEADGRTRELKLSGMRAAGACPWVGKAGPGGRSSCGPVCSTNAAPPFGAALEPVAGWPLTLGDLLKAEVAEKTARSSATGRAPPSAMGLGPMAAAMANSR